MVDLGPLKRPFIPTFAAHRRWHASSRSSSGQAAATAAPPQPSGRQSSGRRRTGQLHETKMARPSSGRGLEAAAAAAAPLVGTTPCRRSSALSRVRRQGKRIIQRCLCCTER